MVTDLAQPIAIVGNLNVDQIVSTMPRFPDWDEEVIVESSRLELAGTAGYLALAARGLGMTPFVVSTIGADEYGAFLRKQMEEAGIDDSGIDTISDTSTCLGIIFVDEQGQRSIITILGAHELMDVDIAERHDATVASCAEVFLCGNYLLPAFSPKLVTPYAERIRKRGQTVVFDPSWDPGGWTRETRQETLALLEHVDLFVPNEEEVCRLMETATWQDAVSRIDMPDLQVVVKRGALGAVSISGDDVVECPGLPVQAINTIGAGDVFDVAYLYGRRNGWDVKRCLEFACATAAFVIAQSGKRSYPDELAVWTFAESSRTDAS